MKQSQYDMIISCIKYGAPAVSQELIVAFNQVMENSNEYVTEKMRIAAAEQKAREDAERKAKEQEAHAKAAEKANLGIKKTTK